MASSVGVPPSGNVRQFKLAKESELRVQVGPDHSLRALLHAGGTAEIFGTDLRPGNWISIPPLSKIAIFTWHGATIELDGTSQVEYVADETPMLSYVNVHAILDSRRARAEASQSSDLYSSQGLRVIVMGPADSGKSSLCMMLLSWACKQGWKPTFVDLDVGQGSITIPGCIAATPIDTPIDVTEGIPLKMPLVHFFGHANPSVNGEIYKVLARELAQNLDRQLLANAESRAAGMVINTMGWIEGFGYKLLLHAIDTFSVNFVLVLGRGNLCNMLKVVLKSKSNVDVVKLHTSGGVVSRNTKLRKMCRSMKISEYFYGIENDLSPHSNIVNFSDILVYQIVHGSRTPRSRNTRVVAVNINIHLLHQVLAISYAQEPYKIISSNVAGFIYVTSIDVQRKKLTFLAPCPHELPSKLLIVGSLEWLEGQSTY